MGRKYRNPPIIEALCELQFEADTPWDLVFPGLIYEQLRDAFPRRRSTKQVLLGQAQEPQLQFVEWVQFLRDDEQALVQIAPQLLSINQLKPYPSWEQFLPLIENSLLVYRNVVNPTSIHRIGLRYINQIIFPQPRIRLADFFEFYPFLGPRLPAENNVFLVGLQIPFENARDMLKLELATSNAEQDDTYAIHFDLDYSLVQPGAVALEDVPLWVNVAHQHIETAFEACITDQLRDMFDEVPA